MPSAKKKPIHTPTPHQNIALPSIFQSDTLPILSDTLPILLAESGFADHLHTAPDIQIPKHYPSYLPLAGGGIRYKCKNYVLNNFNKYE
jgi:hypothetical protein